MKYSIPILLLFLVNWTSAQSYKYPASPKIPVENTYHGVTVVDDYRWLEKLYDKKSWKWKDDQNKFTNNALKKYTREFDFKSKIASIIRYKFRNIQKHGPYYVTFEKGIVQFSKKLDDPAKQYVNPVISGQPGIVSDFAFSKDGRYVAYRYTEKGSDWGQIGIKDIVNDKQLPIRLVNVRQSKISWKGDGFFYTRFPTSQTLKNVKGMEVYYHKVGTKQEDDMAIVSRPAESSDLFTAKMTSDERFLVVMEYDSKGKKRKVRYIDYESTDQAFKEFSINSEISPAIIDFQHGKFIATSNYENDNGLIITIDPETSDVDVLVDERTEILRQVIPLKDKFLAIYDYDMKEKVICYDYTGKELNVLNVKKGWSVKGFQADPADKELYFYYTTYTYPPAMYTYNVDTYETTLFQKTTVKHNVKDYEWKVIEYPSKDSTIVTMMIVYKKGMQQNGTNPTILKTYGGFGITEKPSFSAETVAFLDQGGVYAFANIRGGGDKGMQWTIDGQFNKKQNSFDDFIAAAEYLIREKYTSSDHLAITGASHGGLIVGACMIQRPELFKVAVPVVGVFDMLRHEKYTVGHLHNIIFGSVRYKEMFEYLYNYSPYHNIDPTVNYPHTMIMTSEYDDRVLPCHSFKFAAQLQNNPAQKNQVLLRVEKDAGHSGPTDFVSYLNEMDARNSFILYWTR